MEFYPPSSDNFDVVKALDDIKSGAYVGIGDPASPNSFCSNGECFVKNEDGHYESVIEFMDEPVDEGYFSIGDPASPNSYCVGGECFLKDENGIYRSPDYFADFGSDSVFDQISDVLGSLKIWLVVILIIVFLFVFAPYFKVLTGFFKR